MTFVLPPPTQEETNAKVEQLAQQIKKSMTEPTRDENLRHFNEMYKDREFKLASLQRSLEHSIAKGYDFGMPNINLMMLVIQLEAQLREMHYVLWGVRNAGMNTVTP